VKHGRAEEAKKKKVASVDDTVDGLGVVVVDSNEFI
jgi:hypothetical protein